MNNIKNIAKNKFDRHKVGVTSFLFHTCNLNCDFCFLGKVNQVTNEYINHGFDAFIPYIRNPEFNSVAFHISGGEVFADFIEDKYIDLYEKRLLEINNEAKLYNKNIDWRFLTNLIFKKTDRIDKLFKSLKDHGVNVVINTSFDFSCRFRNKENLRIFFENFKHYEDYIAACNIMSSEAMYKCLLEPGLCNDQEKAEVEMFYKIHDYVSKHEKLKYVLQITGMVSFGDENIDALTIHDSNKFKKMYYYLLENYPFFFGNLLSPFVDDKQDKALFSLDETVDINRSFKGSPCAVNCDCEEEVAKYIIKHDCLNCKYYTKCETACGLFSHDRFDECMRKLVIDYYFNHKDMLNVKE